MHEDEVLRKMSLVLRKASGNGGACATQNIPNRKAVPKLTFSLNMLQGDDYEFIFVFSMLE